MQRQQIARYNGPVITYPILPKRESKSFAGDASYAIVKEKPRENIYTCKHTITDDIKNINKIVNLGPF